MMTGYPRDKAALGTRACRLAGLAAALALLSIPCVHATEISGGYTWPTPNPAAGPMGGPLGVKGVVTLPARADVIAQPYGPTERRTIQYLLDDMAQSPAVFGMKRAPNAQPMSHHGWYVLQSAFGAPARNGFSVFSYSRAREVVDIIARDHRVIDLGRGIGPIVGPFFAFKGEGQFVDNYESHSYTFNDAGEVVSFEPWSEDLSLYQQLGGKLSFDGDIAASKAILDAPEVVTAQPAADAAAMVAASIASTPYTAGEKRNVETLQAILADPGGFDHPARPFFNPAYHNIDTDAAPYKILASVKGSDPHLRLASISGLKRTMTDLIAVGDRAFARVQTTGRQTGPLFGAAPTGLPLRWNEEIYLTFDGNGHVLDSLRLPMQSEIYLELGGQFVFPYLAEWRCPHCPGGPATLDLPVTAAAAH